MKKAFIIGICGKMGKNLLDCANEFNFCVTGGYDRSKTFVNDIPVFCDVNEVDVDYDVVIDFSRPCKNTIEAIELLCKKKNIPAVIATTGFDDDGLKAINELSKIVPVFFSANMSLGVAATKAAALTAQAILGNNFDIEIVEKHHNQKVDAPSGTALLLADALTDRANQILNRNGKRNKGELGITSVRGGGVVGEHEIGFYGENEIVTISHSARSRKLFAAGAYKAAEFLLATKTPALYNMDDLVKTLVRV